MRHQAEQHLLDHRAGVIEIAMRLAAGAVHDVVALALAGVDPLPLEDVAAGRAARRHFAARIASTLVFGRPSAAGIFPSSNWTTGNPFGSGSALGMAVKPAGSAATRLLPARRGPAGRRRGGGLRDLAGAADQRQDVVLAAALVIGQVAVVVVGNDDAAGEIGDDRSLGAFEDRAVGDAASHRCSSSARSGFRPP